MNILDYTFDKYCNGECALLDAHCHMKQALDFKLLCFGLIPSGFPIDKDFESKNIKIGLGFHPWACKNAEMLELDIFKKFVDKTSFIGEIGLDFSDNHKDSKEKQLEIFEKICQMLQDKKDKVISLHAVKSADKVMEIVEKYQLLKNNIVIMHWFSGSNDSFMHALSKNYYFSIGPKMFATNKGYDYIRQIPENRMFIETDLPWDAEEVTAEEHLNLLNDFVMQLREVKFY